MKVDIKKQVKAKARADKAKALAEARDEAAAAEEEAEEEAAEDVAMEAEEDEAVGMSDDVLRKFAKALADTNKSKRDSTVKAITAWLRSREKAAGKLSRLELLKLWKGLYFCMWMSDKPQVQLELAEALAQLVQLFRRKSNAIMFLRTFFATMRREWRGLDRWRLDKFYSLMRFVVREGLALGLKKKALEEVSAVFLEEVLTHRVDGLRYHLCDVYLDEVVSSGCAKSANMDDLQEILSPFYCLLGTEASTPVVMHALKRVLVPLASLEAFAAFDLAELAKALFSLAADVKDMKPSHRKLLYKLVRDFKREAKDRETEGEGHELVASDEDTAAALESSPRNLRADFDKMSEADADEADMDLDEEDFDGADLGSADEEEDEDLDEDLDEAEAEARAEAEAKADAEAMAKAKAKVSQSSGKKGKKRARDDAPGAAVEEDGDEEDGEPESKSAKKKKAKKTKKAKQEEAPKAETTPEPSAKKKKKTKQNEQERPATPEAETTPEPSKNSSTKKAKKKKGQQTPQTASKAKGTPEASSSQEGKKSKKLRFALKANQQLDHSVSIKRLRTTPVKPAASIASPAAGALKSRSPAKSAASSQKKKHSLNAGLAAAQQNKRANEHASARRGRRRAQDYF